MTADSARSPTAGPPAVGRRSRAAPMTRCQSGSADHPLDEIEERGRLPDHVVGLAGADHRGQARLGGLSLRRPGAEEHRPLGQLGRDPGQQIPGAPAGRAPRSCPRRQHRGGPAQRRQVRGCVALPGRTRPDGPAKARARRRRADRMRPAARQVSVGGRSATTPTEPRPAAGDPSSPAPPSRAAPHVQCPSGASPCTLAVIERVFVDLPVTVRAATDSRYPIPPQDPSWSNGAVHPATDKVARALSDAGASGAVRELDSSARTAALAAQQLGVPIGAIANSLVFAADGQPLLVLTSGAHRVDTDAAGPHAGRATDIPGRPGLRQGAHRSGDRRGRPGRASLAVDHRRRHRARRLSGGVGGGRASEHGVLDDVRRTRPHHRRGDSSGLR